jgi:hypothetical protein
VLHRDAGRLAVVAGRAQRVAHGGKRGDDRVDVEREGQQRAEHHLLLDQRLLLRLVGGDAEGLVVRLDEATDDGLSVLIGARSPARLGRLDLAQRNAEDLLLDRLARLQRQHHSLLDVIDQHRTASLSLSFLHQTTHVPVCANLTSG